MDRRLKELLDWLAINQGQNYVGEDPTSPIRIKPNDLGFGGRVRNLPEKIKPTATPDRFGENRTPYFPRVGDDWEQLLNKAQVGSAMPKLGGKQRISDLPLGSATQGDGMSDHLAATYGEDSPEFKRHEAQDAGIELPKGRDWINKMHDIQNAYFTGADFGYEEFWPQRLRVTNEMIDMFMAVPEEALQYAMDNPTDAVLEQFEEYYGFPLNVNDPDMQKYFSDRKKKR